MPSPSRSVLPAEPPPDGAVLIPLTNGPVALVDAEDAERVRHDSWHVHTGGYAARARRSADGPGPGTIFMHRLILDAPARVPVYRRNAARLDNRRANLRLGSVWPSRAGSALRRDNTSGVRGVTWCKRYGTWQAQLQVAGKRHFLGYFARKEDAARAYAAAVQDVFEDGGQRTTPHAS